MNRRSRLTLVICYALSAQACAESRITLHPPSPSEKEEAEPQTAWKCETGAWQFDASGNPYKLDAPASTGPYDKKGNLASSPEDHGAYTVTAFAMPGSTLVNGQCYIDTSEGHEFKLPAGVAIVRSSAATHSDTPGWTCSALLPHYTDSRKKRSMPDINLHHIPHLTINTAVSYCYVVRADFASHPAESVK
jgi:hypothetical protein